MFCKYCGAKTVGESDVCESCREQLRQSDAMRENRSDDGYGSYGTDKNYSSSQTYSAEIQPQPLLDKKGRAITPKYCFGKGMASMIVGIVSIFVFFIVMSIAAVAITNGVASGSIANVSVGGIIFGVILSVGMGVFALVTGIQTIIGAASALKLKVKAIAPLVFGIVGTSAGALTALYGFIFFFGFIGAAAL